MIRTAAFLLAIGRIGKKAYPFAFEPLWLEKF